MVVARTLQPVAMTIQVFTRCCLMVTTVASCYGTVRWLDNTNTLLSQGIHNYSKFCRHILIIAAHEIVKISE